MIEIIHSQNGCFKIRSVFIFVQTLVSVISTLGVQNDFVLNLRLYSTRITNLLFYIIYKFTLYISKLESITYYYYILLWQWKTRSLFIISYYVIISSCNNVRIQHLVHHHNLLSVMYNVYNCMYAFLCSLQVNY